MYASGADGGEQVRAAATAVDLGGFGSAAWMRAVVVDYPNHFSALKNAEWFKSANGEEVLNPDESEMADWSGDAEALASKENKANVDALVAFLVAQAGHNTRSGVRVEQDKAKLERGRVLAVEGDWAGAINGTSCADCHSTIGDSFTEIGDDDAEGYPNLSGYGSSAWLKSFLSDPGAAQHYGEKNQMPAYAERMTPAELDLLIRWLTGDYAETELKPYEDQREKPKAAASEE